jgi:hypothetical protein
VSGKDSGAGGYSPAPPATLTIEEIERLFAIFRQATGEPSGSMATSETDGEKATRLLNEQLHELESVRGLNCDDAHFKAWRDTTSTYLTRFLPSDSPHRDTFRNLSFRRRDPFTNDQWGSPRATRQRQLNQEHFLTACKTAETTIKAGLKHIKEFGVHVEPAKAPAGEKGKGGGEGIGHSGVQQHFYSTVEIRNQVIATDSATQNIGQMGDTIGASLKEIAEVLKQSENLTRREVGEGLAGIETLAVEVQKPAEKRNWKSVLDCGQAVLAIAGKATDLAHKLAPYAPHVVALVDQAKHFLQR